jgi:hypothetical protein
VYVSGDVGESIAAFVPVAVSVGQLPDADAVHHDDDGSGEWHWMNVNVE